MMKSYQYRILRYTHDRATGEFVNVGVVLYAPQDRFLKALVTNRYARVSNFFQSANGQTIVNTLRRFRQEIDRVARQFDEVFPMPASLEQITDALLPPDDSTLQLTPLAGGIDLNPDAALTDLYQRVVEKYLTADSSSTQTDEEAWRQVYKAHFDKYGITSRLIEHEVQTANDSFVFEKAWKNEVWHCYQPLSLNLTDDPSVRTKIYRWSGMLTELATSSEAIHLTFLLTRSQTLNDMYDFVHSKLEIRSESLRVDLVTEAEAETIARQVKAALDLHDAGL